MLKFVLHNLLLGVEPALPAVGLGAENRAGAELDGDLRKGA